MINIGYIFKPKKSQVDRIGRIVADLKEAGIGIDVGVSKFYEYIADKAISEYELTRDRFIEDLKSYLRGTHNL